MTLLEAIQLVNARPAEEVSAEELLLLRKVVDQQPSLAAAVGGRKRLDAYLAAAEAGVAARPDVVAVAAEPVVPAVAPASPALSRRGWELAVYGALILLVGGLLTWQLAPLVPRADGPRANLAAQPATQSALAASGTPGSESPSDTSKIRQPAPNKDDAPLSAGETAETMWRDWEIDTNGGGRVEFQSVWDLTDASQPEPVKLLIMHGGPVRLTCTLDIPADAKMLAVDCRQMLGTPEDPQAATPARPPGSIRLSVDGQETDSSPVPAPDYPGSLMLDLGGAHGRRAKLVLDYKPVDVQERVIVRSFGFSKAPSDVLLASGEPEARNKHLRLWLRADSGIRDAAGRGPHEPQFDGLVQSWEDRSTGGRHVTSDTGDASRRPTYAPSLPQIAGQPAVAFDAQNDFLRYSVGGVYVGGPSTTLAVFYLTHMHSTRDKHRTCVVFDAVPSGVSLSVNNRARVKNGHTVMFGPLGVSLPAPFDGKFVVVTGLCDGAASFLDVNGGLRTPGTMENVKSETALVLGLPASAPPAFGGYPVQIAELLVYDRALTDVEFRQLGQYLARRYGIAGGY